MSVVAAAPQALTFKQLVEREPRLGALLKEAQAVRDPGGRQGFCANREYYGWAGGRNFKATLSRFVGWGRLGPRDEVLESSVAYDLAVRRIHGALPPCRRGPACGCLWLR